MLATPDVATIVSVHDHPSLYRAPSTSRPVIDVQVFIDESKKSPECPWLYIGMLVVPDSRLTEALDLMDSDRNHVGYHRELHFTNAKSRVKTDLARRWLDHVMYGRNRLFHFSLLGIDTKTLDATLFGPDPKTRNPRMYERFLRTSLTGGPKWFFPGRRVNVTRIVQDKGDMEHDPYFDWRTLWRVSSENPNISFDQTEITFADSDHTKERLHPDASHFIQMSDITLGAFRQCIEATSRNPARNELGLHVSPLLQRAMSEKQRTNPNSRYDHYRRISVGFFPAPGSKPGDDRALYRSRDLKQLSDRQLTLDF